MVCVELKPGVEGWKAQTNPLNYGGIPYGKGTIVSVK